MNEYVEVTWAQMAGDQVREGRCRTYYSDLTHPRYIPHAARCDSTILEWERWHRKHNTEAWQEYQKGESYREAPAYLVFQPGVGGA